MGRIRSFKPELLEDVKTAELDDLAFRMFVSIVLLADDFGNLRGDIGYIHGACLWGTHHSREDSAKAIETLAGKSLLTRYESKGQRYIAVTNWAKHQRVDKPGRPRIPGPADPSSVVFQCVASDSPIPRKSSRDSREHPENDLGSRISDLGSGISDLGSSTSRSARVGSSPRFTPPEAVALATAATAEINRRSGRSFRADNATTVKDSVALVAKGYTAEQAVAVVRLKADEWAHDPKMAKHVCPSTLLRPSSFSRYLGEVEAGPARVSGSGYGASPTQIALAELDLLEAEERNRGIA